ncbi:MAG: hypothetical protein AAFR54_15225 [Planctomycetota bacterium]
MQHETTTGRSRLRTVAGKGFLAVWIPLVTLGVSSLMVGHIAPLPAPRASADSASPALRRARARGADLAVVHFLYADCSCSQRVAEHLTRSERPAGAAENVMLVGDDDSLARALEARGFVVEAETQTSAEARFGSFAAPALTVLDAESGRVEYVGGYTSRKQGLDVRDLEIIAACAEGAPPAALPVLGCGATADLERMLDPLRIKN